MKIGDCIKDREGRIGIIHNIEKIKLENVLKKQTLYTVYIPAIKTMTYIFQRDLKSFTCPGNILKWDGEKLIRWDNRPFY